MKCYMGAPLLSNGPANTGVYGCGEHGRRLPINSRGRARPTHEVAIHRRGSREKARNSRLTRPVSTSSAGVVDGTPLAIGARMARCGSACVEVGFMNEWFRRYFMLAAAVAILVAGSATPARALDRLCDPGNE